METIQVETFSFSELSAEARAVALEWAREFAFDVDNLTEWFISELDEKGFSDVDCYWSLSSCQGDGVAFYTKKIQGLDVSHLAEKQPGIDERVKRLHAWDVDFKLTINCTSNHYNHWNTMSVHVEGYDIPDPERWQHEGEDHYHVRCERRDTTANNLLNALEAAVQELVKDISKELEAAGYKEIEYQRADEQVAEMIEANEYRFAKDGKRTVTL